MEYDLTFIHTAKVHVNTFQSLIDLLAPRLRVRHIVEPSFLAHAQRSGIDQTLTDKLELLLASVSQHSQVVVVSCSSIGELAEKFDGKYGSQVQRVDRAMADLAVTKGGKILVLAALESTLRPTLELLESSMRNLHQNVDVSLYLVENAWEYFSEGDHNAYLSEIAKAITAKSSEYDLVVLAQASMAGAESYITSNIPVLSSPKLGVLRAIQSLEES
ncbi:hypothetical protein EK599_21430 [Vibrio sp. T187]|uniref:hypothetical protein n=1 Tax=Vibrio TaxID=662 RepID=UPI0010CA1573|nr:MULTISPECIES: hypothetical protein [Vibrio]MBW3698240.1 hypothetical protein [Vibrio sp. T187]